MKTPDLRNFLGSWPYDPDHNVRLARIGNKREIMVVRQPMGLEQYELDGRPDGQRPHGLESVLEFQLARLAAAEDAFRLSAADCAELFNEGVIYYYRCVSFFPLKDWVRAERDTERNLRLLDLAKRYAEHEEDRVRLDQWRPEITCMNAVARAMLLLDKGQYDEALKIARADIGSIAGVDEPRKSPRALANALVEKLRACLAIRPDFRPCEESVFNSIAEQLTSATGLGGRDRRTGAPAERARSAVTRRIKESITRIAEVLPLLGHHLGARIKTGYFCSYNPHPDRPVAWKF